MQTPKSPPANYLKLSARSDRPLPEPDALVRPAALNPEPFDRAGEPRLFVTSWVFPFGRGKLEAERALAEAQTRRAELRRAYPGLDFQLASWRPSGLPGVRVIGENVRKPLASVEGEVLS